MRRLLSATLLSLALCLVLFATACKGQPLPADKAEFAGHWRGGGVDLVIRPEGHVTYEKAEGKGRVQVEGPLQGWIGNDFVVGVMVVKTNWPGATTHEVEQQVTTVVVSEQSGQPCGSGRFLAGGPGRLEYAGGTTLGVVGLLLNRTTVNEVAIGQARSLSLPVVARSQEEGDRATQVHFDIASRRTDVAGFTIRF